MVRLYGCDCCGEGGGTWLCVYGRGGRVGCCLCLLRPASLDVETSLAIHGALGDAISFSAERTPSSVAPAALGVEMSLATPDTLGGAISFAAGGPHWVSVS